MNKIKSRSTNKQSPEYKAALQEVAAQCAVELDMLVDKMDSFLEMRIQLEVDELKDDILQTKTINDALMEENIQMRQEIEQLTYDNLKLALAAGN